MKKITLGLLFALTLSICSNLSAQVLNENANWPNAAWTITGTYTVAPVPGDAFEADPRVDTNFSYNDDDNATGADQSFDDIAAESPVIDLTAAAVAGEVWITVAGNYVYNRVDDIGELLAFQYWDVDAANWVNFPGGVFDAARQTVSQPTDNLCSGDFEAYATDVLNISSFTATQLSGFRYRIYYDDDFDGGNAWEYGFCFDAPTITSATPPACPDPINLTATTLNSTDVDLEWVETGSAASWNIEIVDITAAGTQTMTPTYTGVSSPYTETMLLPGNEYAFYVQADCAGDGTSNWVGPVTWTQPNLGDVCEAAIIVGALPYTTTDDTSNYGDDYSGVPGTDCGVAFGYLDGDDVVYEYTATSDTSINISLTDIGSTYVGIFVYNDCADIGVTCAAEGAFNDFAAGTDDLEFDLTVTNGETYYFVISTWANPQSTTYTLNIVENTCTNSTISYTVVNDCDVSGGFLIDVEVTDLGSATDITIVNDQDATVYNVSATGTYQFGPYANATDVIVSVSDDNDVNCFQNSGVLTQVVCPPDNVDCSTAEVVTIGVGEDGPTVTGTNDGAGDSGVPDPSCNAFYEGGDVWYQFTVPVGATEVFLDVDSSSFSSIIAVVYDNCTDLNEVFCETIFSSSASFNITGLTGDTTYFLRLYDFGNDSIGPIVFNINTPALSIDDFETLGFKYFPNPVKNNLTLKANQNIQNISVVNMLGQEVLRISPNTLESNLDMNGLNTGSYFVKVTINNATETIRVVKQ